MYSSVDEELSVGVELAGLSSFSAIAAVALPAIVLNAAPPLTVAVQTALLGNYAPTSALAAFAAVGTCVGLVSRVFNFLVDGVSSKVGRSAGARDWRALSTHVQLSMRWSVLLGVASVPLLLAVRTPLCSAVLALSSDVQAQAGPYWVLRAWVTPLQLLNMSAAGILQGFSRVRVNAALTSSAALLEMVGSTLVLRWHAAHQQAQAQAGSGLVAMGCVTLACQALLALASLACILALPPPEARGRVQLAREVFGLSRHSRGTEEDGDQHEQPLLLEGGSGEAGGAAGGEAGTAAASGTEGLERASSSPRAAAEVQHRLMGQQEEGQEEKHGAAHPARAGRLAGRLLDDATREFLRDGANMFVRSMTLQLTFFMALAAAARLGTATLAAHSIVGQLWVVISYAVDGFAAAGIVLGSRLFGHARNPVWRLEAKKHMQRLIFRTLLAGLLSGLAAGVAFHAARQTFISLFSSDPEVVAVLHGGAWLVLAAAQPLNGLLFVFDGLSYATQNFRFVRNNMVSGFILLFCPLLALQSWLLSDLAAIWLCKAALNVWRLAGAAYLMFYLFLPHFGGAGKEEHGQAAAAGEGGSSGGQQGVETA